MINAARLNRLQLLEQEQLNRNRKANEEAEAARYQQQLQQSKAKFNYVSSTASTGFASRHRVSGEDPEIRVYISECGGEIGRTFAYRESEALASEEAQFSNKGSTTRAPVAGSAGTRKGPLEKLGNRSSHASNGQSRVPSLTSSAIPSYSLASTCQPGEKDGSRLGHVPRYLQHRKAELEAAKRASLAEKERLEQEAKIPPGYRLVPEEEKMKTIEEANQRLKELEVALRKIPIRFDTQNIRQKREKIEEEMDELEQTKKKFSTKRPLYVPK